MSFEDGDCIEPNVLAGDERLPPDEVRGRELEAARISVGCTRSTRRARVWATNPR